MDCTRRRARLVPLFAPTVPPLVLRPSVLNRLACPCLRQHATLRACSTIAASMPPPHTPRVAPQKSSPETSSIPDTRDASVEALELLEWTDLSERVSRLARTTGGRSLLLSSNGGLKIPITREGSELLLEQTREAYALEHRLNKSLPLSGVCDVVESAQLATKGGILTGTQLREIASTLAAARRVHRHIDAAHAVDKAYPRLAALARVARTWPEVERVIKDKIDDFGDVSDAADPVLAGLRTAKRDTIANIREKLGNIMTRHADAIQERVITTRYDRFVILVKMSRKALFKSGTVHDVSATGVTAFIEPAAVRGMNDKLRQVTAMEKTRVNEILRQLSANQIAPIANDIIALSDALSAIDAACARARAAYDLDAVDVRFTNNDGIGDQSAVDIRGLRHPLLAWAAISSANQDAGRMDWKADVVPSDYLVPQGVRCVCITGPNTGGKTVALKTLGLAALMAKAGLFIVADGVVTGRDGAAHIPYFDKVLVDIGDDQSLVQSLSTFSGHVQRIKRILAATTSRSLVLFDEIGSGTDPAEGAALGAAILRSLAVNRNAALTLATTHHGELKTLKYARDGCGKYFENACVEFDDVAMKPTYRLLWGIPGRSNALAIAQRLGLSDDIIADAKCLLAGTDSGDGAGVGKIDFEEMIADLEQERRSAEAAAGHARAAREEATALRNAANERLQKLAAAETGLRENQQAAVDEEIARAKKSIADVIRSMQRAGPSAQSAATASGRLTRLENSLKRQLETSPTQERSAESQPLVVAVGDSVQIPRLGDGFSEVVEISGGGDVVLAVGRMRAKVKRVEITAVRQPSKPVQNVRRNISQSKERKIVNIRTAANAIDVRGERVVDASARVDQAMSKAFAIGTLWIIHGHGSGKLRAGIREFLKDHVLVEKFSDAENHDGGTGVTVVILK